jgi:RimJ/RimL family protein N-acetyltransferase
MNYILETERLRLREFNLSDTPFIIELLNSPGWLKYIGDRNVRTEEQAISYLQDGPMKSYKANGYGLSLVERKEDNASIGMCGIINRAMLECPDIGFAFLPAYTGKGYAEEIARATLAYAQKQLRLPNISAITVAENISSIRLLEKLGLGFIRPFCFPNSKEELLLYSN